MNPGALPGNPRPANFATLNTCRHPVVAVAVKVMDCVNTFNWGIGRVQEMQHENDNVAAGSDLGIVTLFNVAVKENPEDAFNGCTYVHGTAACVGKG